MSRLRTIMLAAALAALLPASAAHATFGPAQVIGDAKSSGPIALAANDRGDRVLVYSTDGAPRVAFARAGRPFAPGRDLPATAREYNFRLAVGPRGDALIVWSYDDRSIPAGEVDIRDVGCCNGVKAVVVPAGKAPGPAKTLWPKGTEVGVHGIAIRDPRHFGVAANVAVLPGNGGDFARPAGVQARFATRRGSWGAPERVTRDQVGSATAFAVTGTGARFLYAHGTDIVERTRSTRGRWSGERRLLRGLPDYGSEISFTADARGGLLAAWTVRSRESAVLRVAAGAPGKRPRTQTAALVRDGSFFFEPVLDAAGNGAALLRWQIGTSVNRSERKAGGRFSEGSFAYTKPTDYEERRVAVSASGRWVASFVAPEAPYGHPYSLTAFTARFGAPVGTPRLIETADDLAALAPTIDRSGRITIAYRNGSSVRVRVGR